MAASGKENGDQHCICRDGQMGKKRQKGNVNLSQESVYGVHQWVPVPKHVHAHPSELH